MRRTYHDMDVVKIINSGFPTFRIATIKTLGSGHDSEAYLINNEFVFKFPKHEKASNNLYKETKVLLEIENKLRIPTPKIEFIGKPNEIFDMYFIGYRKIAGDILTPTLFHSLSKQTQEQIAIDIARFLKALHSMKLLHHAKELEQDKKEKYIQDYNILKKLIFPVLNEDEKEKIKRMYKEIASNHTFFHYHKCLIHNDFSADHILFDKNIGRVCGVIDFGDVAISDPDNDFMYLLEDSEEEYGKDFGLKVLKHYNHPNIDSVMKKSDFHEFYWCFEQVILGKEYGYDDWYHEGLERIRNL